MVSRRVQLILGGVLCGVLCGVLSGCATPTGEAVADWLAAPLDRLRAAADPDRLVVPEIRRARSLLPRAGACASREVRRSPRLLQGTLDRADRVLQRTQRLPGRLTALLASSSRAMKRRAGDLVAPEGLLRNRLDPTRQASALRRIYRRMPRVLALDRPILSGPGDPDRQTVAHPTGPTQTWVQKILRRIRL